MDGRHRGADARRSGGDRAPKDPATPEQQQGVAGHKKVAAAKTSEQFILEARAHSRAKLEALEAQRRASAREKLQDHTTNLW